ncbi:AzlC family ABC transporter permease [Enterocloster lavalensis]|uniref:AzlC family ABC transporter permease n=1 Tax=Enterocloster lavalensis TaxID=460384 RepID=UPI002FD8B90C
MKSNRDWYLQGAHDGLPIAMGYLAVSFTLGIAARNVGLGAFPASLMSITNLTSAGQFAALGLITAGTSYVEMACTQLIINLRYFLMSCALSQKLDPNMHFFHRLLVAYGVTDEIFGISIGSGRMLNPFYAYGAISVAAPSWTLGAFLGVVSGNVLPARVLNALNVALYGMFIAVIVPPARKQKVLAGLVAVSMAASLLFTLLPVVSQISTGMRIIILTVLVAGAGAVLFPVEEAEEKEELHEA